MDPLFFATAAAFRNWLERHHDSERELLVGFYKKGSGQLSVDWPESVDQALCFGWIDGVRKRIDDESYSIRFTPRKAKSTWSAVNIKRVKQLTELGLMKPPGLVAFSARSDEGSAIYAYEQHTGAVLDESQKRMFMDNAPAWEFFQSQPAWYQRTATWWVISAKKEATRAKRLATLIADSAEGRPIASLTRGPKSG